MLKRKGYLAILTTLSISLMAASYEKLPPDRSGNSRGVLSAIYSWIIPVEPPIVPPVFRPITRELTREEKKVVLNWHTESFEYLGVVESGHSKNIQRGIELLNAAAECGQESACNSFARFYRSGKCGEYDFPVNLDLADDYERHRKWLDLTTASVAPKMAEEIDDRRSSGDSDGSTSASDASEDSISVLRHRAISEK